MPKLRDAFIPGRSGEASNALIALARDIGVDPVLIIPSRHPDGYTVPGKLARAFGVSVESEDSAQEGDASDGNSDE